MAKITAAMVKELRDTTGISMMTCKKALSETDGDMEAAITSLRKQGLATAEKKSSRATNAGGIGLAIGDGAAAAVIVSCETDFVSGNDVFKAFLADLAKAALDNNITDLDGLASVEVSGEKASEALIGQIQKLGENMNLVSVTRLEGEVLSGYNHGGRIATLVAGKGDAAALRNVAMHAAAAQPEPIALNREAVCPDLVAKEKSIIEASKDVQAKPEQFRDKIVDGKLGRFFKENVLLEQDMLVDAEKGSVQDYAKEKGSEVTGFVRVNV